MMNTTILNVKIDKQLKADAQAVAEGMGFKLGTLVNAYLRELISTRRVLFALRPETDQVVAALKRIRRLGAPIRKRLGIKTDHDFVRLMKTVGIDFEL